MREISEATLAILKSQNLTGQNRFSYSLRLEGTEYYSDVKKTLTNILNTSATWADYCIRSDGKVLFAYLSGTGIYLKVIDSEEDMLSISLIGTAGTLFYTFGGSAASQCFSLFREKNGRLLLFVNDAGNFTTGIPYALKVYESINGLGNDFILKTIINTSTRKSTNIAGLKNIVGKSAQDKDGNIWLFAGIRSTAYDDDYTSRNIYKSSNGGLTWELKYNSGAGTGSARYDAVKNIVIVGNSIFVTISYDYGGANTYLYISTDSGASWVEKTGNFANLPIQESNNSSWRTLIDFFYNKDGYLHMIIGTPDGKANLYKLKVSQQITYEYLDNISNWSLVQTGISRYNYGNGFLSISPRGTIHYLHVYGGNTIRDTGLFRDEYSSPLSASSISISKGKGSSNTATIQASNKDGALNPKNPDGPLYNILKTNKQIIIKQGYGDDLIETFTGMIDDFDMSTWPQTTGIALRDNLKKALDQTITEGTQHTKEFASQPIENIVGYLCYLANIEVGDDAIEPTGISVAMNFSWCSYADAFQQLGDLASFEWGCDSYGKFYFRRDYQPDNMFVAYTFEEGVDLATLKYKISDKDLYSKVVVFGKSGDTVISYEAPFLDAALYNILPQKILKIDATEASTVGALRKIAERAISMMQSRTAVIQFTSIGIPWLEPGDFIGIYERSTGAASIYRLSDLSFSMDKESFTMSGTAYYYGDSIVPGELPTDTATQTIAPTTNLIPEMTSNTAPSGVARASSIYTSNYEPWQAFNSHSDDYYWNSITNIGWIEYQFPEKTIVDKYILKARQLTIYNDAMPRDWTFEGFDGEKWVVLDTQTGQTNWGVYQSRTYLFANATAYSKYRLNVSRNDGYMRLQLEQLAMYYGGGA